MLTHQKFVLADKVIMELKRRIEALEESAGGGSDLANRVEALELALAQKADTSYVNTELGKKVNTTTFNTELGKKADTSYVNTELGKKANASDLADLEARVAALEEANQ